MNNLVPLFENEIIKVHQEVHNVNEITESQIEAVSGQISEQFPEGIKALIKCLIDREQITVPVGQGNFTLSLTSDI